MAKESLIRFVIQEDSHKDRSYLVKVPHDQLLPDDCSKLTLSGTEFLADTHNKGNHYESKPLDLDERWRFLEDHRYAKMPIWDVTNLEVGDKDISLSISEWEVKKMSNWNAFEYLNEEDIAPLQHEFDALSSQDGKFHPSVGDATRTEILSENSQKLRLKFGLRTKIKRKHFFDDSDDESKPSKQHNLNSKISLSKRKVLSNKHTQGKPHKSSSKFSKPYEKNEKKVTKPLRVKIQSSKLCSKIKKQKLCQPPREPIKGFSSHENHHKLPTKLCKKKFKGKYFTKTFASISLDNVVATKRRSNVSTSIKNSTS